MKKYSIIFLLFGFISVNLCSQTKSSILSFDKPVFDFGKINEKDGNVSHTFTFKNTGKNPVTINTVVTGCGCVSNDYTKETIKPGEKGTVTITYNPYHRPGDFSREITIFSNNGDYVNWVTIKGHVIPYDRPVEEDYPYAFGDGLYLNFKVLYYPRIAVGSFAEILLRYANDTDKPMTLEFVVEGNNSDISFANPAKLKAKERGQMTVKYTMSKAINGEIQTNIYPVVNSKKLQQPILLKVMGSK